MILAGASTGLRITDAALLEWKNVDLERGTIVLFPEKKREREGVKTNAMVVLSDLANHLEA